MMTTRDTIKLQLRSVGLLIMFVVWSALPAPVVAQDNRALTPAQREIERQRERLGSLEVEERRDALMRLANLKRPEASRAATGALNDRSPTVKGAAAHAIVWLPGNEAVSLLLPLLKDKSEFVRREVVFALGETRHQSAVTPLTDMMTRDKEPSVRAAAAMALGHVGDATAVVPLMQVVTGAPGKKKKPKNLEEEFVVRSAVQALGQIGSRVAVPTIITALQDETNSIDTRREAATALGLIGDPSAVPALEAAFAGNVDPYLSEVAHAALKRIRRAGN